MKKSLPATSKLLMYLVVLAILLISSNLFSQSDLYGPKKRVLNIPKLIENSPPSRSPDAPTIIINVPGNYSTIQAAINAANNGDVITVDPGTYREDIILNKFLQIRGANYGINPTGFRGAESIIQPATSEPDPDSAYVINFYIGANGSGSKIDGFTFDGDNPTLNSGLLVNGADIDAADAIGAYDNLSNTTVSNNIIKNVSLAGVDFDNFSTASTYDNIITGNKFDNVLGSDYGIGVLIYDNCYASITYNVMTRVRLGVQTGNFNLADIGTNHSINNNEIESYRLAIWHNLLYQSATTFDIKNNVITTVTGSQNNIGIEISSIQSSVAVNVDNNNVSDAREGYDLWNCPTTATVTITNSVLTNCNVGMFANNYDGYDLDASSSVYAMSGITFTNCDTAIRIKDNSLNSNSATVALNIVNTTNIVNGTGIGLLIEGADASVSFTGAVPVNFSTSLSKYIRLATNGSNVPSANIDATSVQFGGTNGAGLTDAQLFAVEDKIDHKIDWVTLGFVSVKANHDYVTINSFYTPNTSSPSIQRGIDAASSGYTINVNSGTYIENFEINKSNLLLRGANYGINPNTGSRGAESIIMPLINDPDYGVMISVQQSFVTMDGFLLNGDNPGLGGGNPVGSADVNTSEGFANSVDPVNGPYFQIDHIDVQNNIWNNFNWQAVFLWEDFGSNHSWNYIKNNKFDNMWEGVQTYAMHADISYNTFTRVDRALGMHGVSADCDLGFVPLIADNTISITWKTGYSRNVGIWVNYRDGNAPDLEVKNNTINCSDASLIGKNFFGFYALSLADNRTVLFSNNTITGAGNCSRGFYMSGSPSSNVTLTGGAFNDIRDCGILIVNFDPAWPPASDTRLNVNNLTITMSAGSYAGILDSADNNFVSNLPGSDLMGIRSKKSESLRSGNKTSSSSTVSALNVSNTTISGSPSKGIIVSGTLASADIHDNSATITGAVIGVDVDGGTAILYRNDITANGTGVRVKNSGNLTSATENFITSNTSEGIHIDANAGTIGVISDNDLSGNTGYAINYLKATPALTATCNWYGPGSPVSEINGNVNWISYLTNGNDDVGGTPGFQPVPASCNGLGPVVNLTQSLSYAAIAPAITAANSGDVIEISAGSYNERVVIDKSLTLQGVDKNTCIIDGTGLAGTGKGIIINTGITNVTIRHLTVQDFAGANGNTDGGIYGNGGNNNLLIRGVIIQNNTGGSGFYANGPVNTVTIDSVNSSGHGTSSRGIVIWNGLKENITITNCEVFNNQCCGVELQDGTASGVTISYNNIHDNFDNGIGIVGLQGPGENLVSNNTVLNNGRFGIEIKNPNGSGLAAGAGRVVIENNTVSRTVLIPVGETRDLAGIAAFRRGVLAGNVDIPNGTVIQNNIVSGYTQPSTSEGFGIVVEGTSHTVSGNTVSGCDVGIQRQAGHSGYPGDGDQSNLADTYFGRGNSPIACGITLSGNILTNTINTRDVGPNVGAGLVTNINTSEIFCSIQTAINDAQTLNSHTIEVSSGTYNEQVIVNKSLVIKGVGAIKPVLDFTGTVSGKPTLIDVSVQDVTIESMRMKVDMTKLSSAVIASGTNIDNITITSDSVEAYASSAAGSFGPYGDRNAFSINYGGSTNYRIASGGVDNVTVQGSTVSGVVNDGFGFPRFFRSAVSTDESGGLFTNNIFQSINHDVLARFGSNGNIDITSNQFNGGGVELADMNAGANILTVSGNTFDATASNILAPNTAVLRLKNNYNSKTTTVSGNSFVNHDWGVSLENYNTVTLDNNTFTPLANSTVFHHIAVNTKSITTNSNAIVQVPVDAILTNNTFNYSGTNGGTALSFHNHDNDNASFGTFTIGTAGNENNFNSGFSNFIYLDSQTGASNTSTFPPYTAVIGAAPAAITTMACWSTNMSIENNKFDVGSGLQLPAAMNFSERTTLETKLFHKPDNMCLGNLLFFLPVHNVTQNTYYQTIQSSITAANANDSIECAEFIYNERVTVDKSLILQGLDRTNCKVDGTGLVGNGKGIAISNGVTNVTIRHFTIQNFSGANGNTDAGIYGNGGNNNLKVQGVTIQNNTGGSGFYANGPVNTVTIDSVNSSGHGTNSRGIVIWNGLKENITITNCEVFNNQCCGVELQDGTASGVTISYNNIHDNFDNGIGIVGLQGPGENLVSNNTVLNNGRFGIEIKNPNGSGATVGAGRVVIENNTVSRTVLIPVGETRDLAGIAAFRRGVLAGNVDIPNGAVIQNNIVSGYTQPSTSEGFGIVVEGTSHTVSGNTVSGCDVGIQRQAGHSGYPGDGDQSNLADTYFGRGNSPIACGITLSGNILTNTINTRDVGPNVGAGVVTNLNTTEVFCSIQAAIDDAQTLNTHVIDVDSGYFSENVVVNKQVVLNGNMSNVNSEPVVEGTSGQTFSVTVPNVTIHNFTIRFNQVAVPSGIRAATSGTFSNLTISSNHIEGTATTGVPEFNSFGIQVGSAGGASYDQLNLDSNDIKHTGTSPLGRGVRTFNCYGNWTNNTINGFYSFQAGDNQGGILNISGNDLKGNAEINYLGSGAHTFVNNTCEPSNAYGGGTDFAMIELKNISLPAASLMISGNSIQNYVNFGIFSGRSNNVTIDNNTFLPDLSAVNFRSIRIDTKQRTITPQGLFVSGAVITNNTFNGNTALSQTGISLELANSDSLSSIGTVTVGSAGNENLFEDNVKKNISLNNETSSTAGDPVWVATYVSKKKKVTTNLDGINNKYDVGSGLEFPAAMSLTNLFSLEDRVQHRIDDGGLGFVLVKANNDYVTVNSFVSPVTTTPDVQRGIDAASPGFVVNVGPGSFTNQLEINKALTVDGQGSGVSNIVSPNTLTLSFMTGINNNKPIIYVHDASAVVIKDLTVDGAGKGNANLRFEGIAYRNAGGTVRNCEVKAVRNTPIDGSQAGVGIYAFADNGTPRTLNVIQNNIYDFQKNATALSGINLTAAVDSNTMTGSGPTSVIAQNGVQIGFGATGSVTNNTVSNFSFTPNTDLSTAVLLQQPTGPITTTKNIISASQAGIYYVDVGGTIQENTISATAVNTGTTSYWGIIADPGGVPRLPSQPFDSPESYKRNNNKTGDQSLISTAIYRNELTSDGTNGSGIYLLVLGTETMNANATENKVNGWDAAVVFDKDAGATLNGVVNDNDLSNNTFALYDVTGVTQDGQCNWFGSTDQFVIAPKVSGAVDYSPYLTNGADYDGGTFGFQPTPGSCNGFPIIAYYVNDNDQSGDVFTFDVGNDGNAGTPAAPFLTISYAVSVANPADTIYVDAGTYQEQVMINKTLSVIGADSAGTHAAIVKAPATIPLVVNANAIDHRPVVYVSGADTVNISHICVDGDGRGGDKFAGVYYFEASGSFNNSRITGVRDATYSGNPSGNAFVANHTYDITFNQKVTVSNNVMEDYQKTGIIINELNTQGIVTNNIVTGQSIQHVNGQNGIQFGYGAYGTITGNTVTGNQYNGPVSDAASGILIVSVGVSLPNVPTGNTTTIGGPGALANIMSGNEVGLLVDSGGFGYTSNAGIIYNENTFAVNYIHVSESNPNTVPSGLNTYDKRIDNPAQTNIVYGQIQRSVDDATAGDVLNVSPHIFTEQVLVGKALTISGQGSGLTNIVAPNSMPFTFMTGDLNTPVIYVHDASSVIIKNLTVDGAGNGNTNYRFQGIAYHDAEGTIRDCEIKSIRQTPLNGNQEGVGIYALADSGVSKTLNIINNDIYDFQKNGTALSGANLITNVDSNTVTGSGPVNFIAQNGIQVGYGATGSVTNNKISNTIFTPISAASCGILIYLASGTVSVSYDTVIDCQTGIIMQGCNSNLSNSQFVVNPANMGSTPYWWGIVPEDGTFFVTGNTIDGGDTTKAEGCNPYSYIGETTDITCTNNYILNCLDGIVVQNTGTGTVNGEYHDNSITDCDIAINNATTVLQNANVMNPPNTEMQINKMRPVVVKTVNKKSTRGEKDSSGKLNGPTAATVQDATCNWYGSTNGSFVTSKISGAVTYVPYLIINTDNSPGTPGFQPVPGSCTGVPSSTLNIKVVPEGLYDSTGQTLLIADTAMAYLHSNISPYNVIDSDTTTIDSLTLMGSFQFSQPSGVYYIVIKHRNSLETWSAAAEVFTAGGTMSYDFTTAATQAFNNNMKQVDTTPITFAIFTGDVDQDGIIDVTDLINIYNDQTLPGYLTTDLNGDYYVDVSDLILAYNNNSKLVQAP